MVLFPFQSTCAIVSVLVVATASLCEAFSSISSTARTDSFITTVVGSSSLSRSSSKTTNLFESTSSSSSETGFDAASADAFNEKVKQAAAEQEQEQQDQDKPPANPDYPNLPELKGDFDWDEKFGGDDDWITTNVPGKIKLDEIALAQQVTALNKLEEKFRKQRLKKEYEEYKTVGWVPTAELLNSRFAMFFLFVGLFTEKFTGVTIPGQVEEMLRILGFIGFD